jgi:hypothetical protein
MSDSCTASVAQLRTPLLNQDVNCANPLVRNQLARLSAVLAFSYSVSPQNQSEHAFEYYSPGNRDHEFWQIDGTSRPSRTLSRCGPFFKYPQGTTCRPACTPRKSSAWSKHPIRQNSPWYRGVFCYILIAVSWLEPGLYCRNISRYSRPVARHYLRCILLLFS